MVFHSGGQPHGHDPISKDVFSSVDGMEMTTLSCGHPGSGNKLESVTDHLDIGSAGDLNAKILLEESAEKKKEEEEETNLGAPDGGYGWVVVFASFLSATFIGGLERGDGIFFLEFQSKFGKSAALTAWPGAIASLLRLAIGPIASAFCERWSARTSIWLGGFLLVCAYILSAFSPNMYFLFVSHGVIQGIARGFIYCPSIVIVNMYFDKRLGLATGLATAGDGMGTVVIVPLVQFLFDTYSFQGGFIVLAGCCLNLFVIAMMYRPLSMHYKLTGHKGETPEKPSPQEAVMLSELTDAGDTTSVRSVRLRSPSLASRSGGANDPESTTEVLVGRSRSTSQYQIQNRSADDDANETLIHKENCLKSSLNIIFPKETGHLNKNKNSDKSKQKIFHFGLLRNLPFLSFCLSLCVFTAAFKSAFTFIPALAASRGMSNSQAAFVLSVTGFVDTGGRMLSGFILDWSPLRPWRLAIYCIVMFTLATLSVLMPIVGYNFVLLSVSCSCYGLLTGLIISQKTTIMVDILGSKLMPKAFGILLIFQAVGVGIGPPMSGAFRDAFGRFHEAFYLGGGMLGVAGCLMIVSTVLHRAQKRKEVKDVN